MWWKYTGFGRFIVLNNLKEETFEGAEGGKKTQVGAGQLTRAQITGRSINTLWGGQKTVVISLEEKEQLGRPGTRKEADLTWWLLKGPPIPDTWVFNYSISSLGTDGGSVSGQIELPTPRGGRPIMRFTFGYAVDDNRDAWYVLDTDRFDWRTETWTSDPQRRLGDSPVARATSITVPTS